MVITGHLSGISNERSSSNIIVSGLVVDFTQVCKPGPLICLKMKRPGSPLEPPSNGLVRAKPEYYAEGLLHGAYTH